MNILLSALVNGAVLSLPLTAAAWLALVYTPRTSLNATTRYAVWWALLLIVLLLPLFYLSGRTAPGIAQRRQIALSPQVGAGFSAVASPVADSAERTIAPTIPADSAPEHASSPIFPIGIPTGFRTTLILSIWAIGALLMVARLTICWIILERRKRRSLPPPEHLMHRVDHWMGQCRSARKAALRVESDLVAGPIATGPWRPSILFPAWMLNEFSESEIDRIGLHEAAHLARRDDYALALQRVLEALFFLHPAVRWIVRQIDLEREIGCDDFVVQNLGAPRLYATCLTRVAELSGGMRPALAASPVTDERSHLTRRIDMLLDKTRDTGTGVLKLRLSAGIAGLVLVALTAAELPLLFSPVLIVAAVPVKASAQTMDKAPSKPAQPVAIAASAPAPKAASSPRLADVPASAQSDGDLQLTLATSPRFTTASITQVQYKPIINGVGGPTWNSSASTIDYHMFPINGLMQKAWPIPFYQIVWPAWMVDGRSGNVTGVYDVSATMPPDTTPQRLQIMYQGLFVDNLKMQAHWETRDLQVYALKIANGGVKFGPSANPSATGIVNGQSMDGFRVMAKGPRQPATAPSGATLAQFAMVMSSKLDNPMVDMTGLEGVYDLNLFVPRDPSSPWPFQPLSGPGPFTQMQRNANWGFNLSTFFQALEAQLGLTAELQTVPTKFLVIDSLSPPPIGN